MYVADVQQWEFLHPTLRAVMSWLETRLGFFLVMTSLYRIGDDGVHGTLPLRAVDFRCRSEVIAKHIVKLVNGHWKYDPNRPEMVVAIAHDTGRGWHIHLQVHENTYEA